MTHLDTDVLAEFRAGLITGRRGARIGGHLAACERCTELSGQLAEVSALLAAVPVPAMPQGVAQRLDSALAAEAARDIYPERPHGGTVRSREARQRRAGSRDFRLVALRVLAPAAAVLLAAGGYGLSRLGGGPSNQASSGSVAAPAAKTPGAAAIGGHQAMSPQRVPQSVFPVVSSTIDYQPATIRRQLAGQLHPATPMPDTGRPATRPVRDCVREVTGGAQPVLVQTARFRGQPATVIVVARNSGDKVWVAGPGCSAGNGHVLYTTTLPAGI